MKLYLGSQIQYTAHYRAENGEPDAIVDSALSWSLEGMPVGELSQDGLLTATSAGYALVYAALDDKETSAFVVVADSSTDTTGLIHVTISVFDLAGCKIETLVNDHQQAGTSSLKWDASQQQHKNDSQENRSVFQKNARFLGKGQVRY
ncbi:MAG: hypothetical protein U5N26_07210 [Candidatus Marinimicrobia bacterium]|nr:hypothetical protein [Candidatus Neomarinimicrobiota bacterium]